MKCCSNCGGEIVGDGYTIVRHCEHVGDILGYSPDDETVLCGLDPEMVARGEALIESLKGDGEVIEPDRLELDYTKKEAEKFYKAKTKLEKDTKKLALLGKELLAKREEFSDMYNRNR